MLNPLRLSAAKKLLGLAACFAFLPGAFGQAPGTGAIRGSVAHSATRADLHGASVRVAGTDLVAFTERDGTFFLAAVPVGQRHLAIDYTGLDQHTQAVTVTASGLPPRASASDGPSTPMPPTPSASWRFGTRSSPAASIATAS
jgi:hypothetical protein